MNAQRVGGVLILLCCVCSVGPCPETSAATIYSYVDEQGNLAYTDTPETIPEKYRGKVKVHEQPDATRTNASPSSMQSMKQSLQQTIAEHGKSFGLTMPSLSMEGLTQNQSKILSYAGTISVVLLLIMYLSKSQLVRMLGFCLLLVVGVGAPILMYIDNSGPIGTINTQANTYKQAQQDRTQSLPR